MVGADGRYAMSSDEIRLKLWTRLKGWVPDPSDPNFLIPNYKPCDYRTLVSKCLPCGRNAQYGYHCNLKNGLVGVKYCSSCEDAIVDNVIQLTVKG